MQCHLLVKYCSFIIIHIKYCLHFFNELLLKRSGILFTTIAALILQCFPAIRTGNTTHFNACTFQPSPNSNDLFDG